MSLKVLVCETSGHHDECLPPFVSTLKSLNITHDIIINAESLALKGNIFSCFDETVGVRPEAITPSIANLHNLAERIRRETYTHIYVNTMTSGMMRFWTSQGVPLLAVCHNIERFGAENLATFFASHPKSRVIVLAPHVRDYLLSTYPHLPPEGILIHYSVATLCPRFETVNGDEIRVAVPGTISFNNRAYQDLANALQAYNSTSRIRICFPGGAAEGQYERFISVFKTRRQVVIDAPALRFQGSTTRHNLFSATHDEYYTSVGRSHVLLPLIKNINNRYSSKSITSTMPLSLCSSIPAVTTREASDLYSTPTIWRTNREYESMLNDLAAGKLRHELSAVAVKLRETRHLFMSHNTQTIASYLALFD
jgi:hypothetical protein